MPLMSTVSSRSSTCKQAEGRHVSITGHSMIRTIEVASELGYLDIPDGVLVELEDLEIAR